MNGLLAAILFFTRLPLWRWVSVPSQSFQHIVSYWSICGWITGGTMAGVFLLTAMWFPANVAIILALIARLLLTGGLHEDGLADFFDGFGGGRDRESTLRIMKDSHIGTYGVLALVMYYLLGYSILSSLPSYEAIAAVMLCADAFAKFAAAHIILLLPYARKEEEAKAQTVYQRLSIGEWLTALLGGVLPFYFLPLRAWCAVIGVFIVFMLLYTLMKRRLQGYTGDCMGATFLLLELTFCCAASTLL